MEGGRSLENMHIKAQEKKKNQKQESVMPEKEVKIYKLTGIEGHKD